MILSYVRTIFLYLVLIFVIRMMGKRQIGEMEPSEFVVTMLVANLASIPMQDGAIPLFSGLVPILTVLGMELVISWLTVKSIVMRRLFCGKPVILVKNGQILEDNLRATRITLDELTGHLRQKDVLNISDVQIAILETDGELSVFLYPEKMPACAADAKVQVQPRDLPVTVICDGLLLEENLKGLGKDAAWLSAVLKKHRAKIHETLLLMADADGNVFFQRRRDGK